MEKEDRRIFKKGVELVIKDSLGVQVYPGDTVVYAQACYSSLAKGVITKLNAKSISVNGSARYSHQFVKV